MNDFARSLQKLNGVKKARSEMDAYEVTELRETSPAVLLYVDVVNHSDEAYTFSVEIVVYPDRAELCSRRVTYDGLGEVLDGDEWRAVIQGVSSVKVSEAITDLTALSVAFKKFADI